MAVPVNIGFLIAVVGSALTALSLTGSRISAFPNSGAATASNPVESSELIESRRLKDEGRARYSGGQYLEARELFIKAAGFAHQARAAELEARNWNNAGGCALARLNFREALEDFLKAKQTAGTSSNPILLAATLNNLASLYLQMNNPDAAMHVAREALDGPAGRAGAEIRSKLQIQFASAASALHRFD